MLMMHRPIGSLKAGSLRGREASCSRVAVQAMADSTAFGSDLFTRQLDGKRFMCTMCGKCCEGDGEVWVNSNEIVRIAAHLNITPQAFHARYTKNYGRYKGWYLLQSVGDDKKCVFLSDKTCSIHAVRPGQCSTYPWWPDLMDAGDWEREKLEICEGFDHQDAPPLDVQAAAAQLKQATVQEQMRMLSRRD